MAAFAEVKLFQVKPDKPAEFEALAAAVAEEQRGLRGVVCVKYMKRFFTIDGVEPGEPPRELTKIVKCVKYYSCWEFDCKESYGRATRWFFENHLKPLQRLLIAPFDIMCGHSIVS